MGWRDWNREQGRHAVDDYLGGRPIRVFDRYGRQIGERVEVNCPECRHWASVVVPAGRKAVRFRCTKCGALGEAAHLETDD
jgi:hypothetical protein